MNGSAITEADHARAVEAGLEEAQTEIRALSARYAADHDAIELMTVDNGGFLAPRRLIDALHDIPAAELANLALWPDGSILELEDRDIHISVHGLVTAILPVLIPRRVAAGLFAAQGGAVRSSAKAASARENGKKGGRPRKQPE